MKPIKKQYNLCAFLTILFSICQLIPPGSFAFKSGSWFFNNVHLEIIEAALTPLGFQPDAIAKIGEGHKSLDNVISYKFWIDKHHCDANLIKEGYGYFVGRMEKGVNIAADAYKSPSSVEQARFTFGEGYHTLQDFYSHSNWIEMQYFEKPPGDLIILFPWHLYAPWSWNPTSGQWDHAWKPNQKLPKALKTGYFTSTEFENEGRKLVPDKLGVDTARADSVRRERMVHAAMQEYPGLRFASELEYQRRMENEKYFHTAIEYAVKDEGRSMLHAELNKDDENQRESKLITPSGESLFVVAKRLATEDTALQWRIAEKQMWRKYDDRAALIIPALKGAPVPELKVKVTIDPRQTRTSAIRGNINVKVPGLPKPMPIPLKVKVEVLLKPEGVPQTSQDRPQVRVLEFKKNDEANIILETLNLVIGNQKGRYDLVVKAYFDCDPAFKPVNQRIPLSSGSTILHSAKYSPNPLLVGEEAKLDVEYSYENPAGGVGEGDGIIEKIDGSYRHTISKQPLNPNTNAIHLYSDKWTPPSPGKYRWYPKITFNTNEEASSVVDIDVVDARDKNVSGSCSLDKTECAIGDTVRLSVKYKVKGLGRNSVVAKETSQIDGPSALIFPESSANLAAPSAGANAERSKVFSYPATKSGVYDWRFAVDVPGYGTYQDTLRFIVKGTKRLAIDNASVSPESGPPGPVNLHVDYRLGAMEANSSQEVLVDSRITGPAGRVFPQSPQVVSSASGAGVVDLSFTGSTPGDYVWTFAINAGPFGNEQRSLAFRIEDKTVRSIDLISAKVTPVKDVVGATHTLEVWYKLSGLKAKETVEVHENDYVQYSKQESNATVSKNVTEPNVNVRKVAGFVSKQAGKHTWNFIIDANGFRTLYGAVPFEAYEEEVKPRLQARLQYPQITLAPDETKNCTIYISGFKSNTKERVEIVYPAVTDNWGTLPGQIQVFPGNTSMDSWNMGGAGDHTKEYPAGQGYRARATAPAGVTPVKIIVRQKDVGQVTLTLFVKIVRKGENTMGTEIENPRLPGTYIPKTRRNGTGTDLPNSGEVETNDGTVGAGGVTTKNPDGSDNSNSSSNSTTNEDGKTGSPSESGSNREPNGGRRTGASSSNTGSTGTGITPSSGNTGSSSGSNAQRNNTYLFSRAIFERKAQASTLSLNQGQSSEGTVTTGESARVPISITTKNSMSYAAPITETVTGDVNVTFPHDFVLVGNQAKVQASATAKVAIERNGEPTLQGENQTPDVKIELDPVGNPITLDSTAFFRDGRRNLSASWQIPLEFRGTNGDKELSATISNAEIKMGDGAVLRLTKVFYVLQGIQDPNKKDQTTEDKKDDASSENTAEDSQLKAWLENPSITLVPGSMPVLAPIMIQGWKRDVSSPIEVVFPGQSFGNKLPDDLEVNPGGGSQDPSALSVVSSDKGVYSWSEGFAASMQAKPGKYKVPIIVRQAGAGQIQLVLDVTVEGKNLRSGVINHGNVQGLLNKKSWDLPATKADEKTSGWNVPTTGHDGESNTTSSAKPSSAWNVPTASGNQPSTGWNVPSSAHTPPTTAWNVPPATSPPQSGWTVPSTTGSTKPSIGWNVPNTTSSTKPSSGWNVPSTASNTTSSSGWNVPTATGSGTKPSSGWNVPSTTAENKPATGWNVPIATNKPSSGWSVPTNTQPSSGWNVPTAPAQSIPQAQPQRPTYTPPTQTYAPPAQTYSPPPQRPTYTPPAQTYTPPPQQPAYTPPPVTPSSPSQASAEIPRYFSTDPNSRDLKSIAAGEMIPSANPNLYSFRGSWSLCMCKGAFNSRLNLLKLNCRALNLSFMNQDLFQVTCTYNAQTRSLQCSGDKGSLTIPAINSYPSALSKASWDTNQTYLSLPMPAIPMD